MLLVLRKVVISIRNGLFLPKLLPVGHEHCTSTSDTYIPFWAAFVTEYFPKDAHLKLRNFMVFKYHFGQLDSFPWLSLRTAEILQTTNTYPELG